MIPKSFPYLPLIAIPVVLLSVLIGFINLLLYPFMDGRSIFGILIPCGIAFTTVAYLRWFVGRPGPEGVE